jgi:tol-pal system protein YbgF
VGFLTATDKILAKEFYRTTLFPSAELKAGWNPSPNNKFRPIAFAGLHSFGSQTSYTYKVNNLNVDGKTKVAYDAAVLIGGGAEFSINDKTSLSVSGDYRYVFSADVPKGASKPKYWVAKAGLSFALSKSAKTFKGEEIEYPMDEKEIASLDDLFKETPSKGSSSKGSKKSTSEDDALSLLFQPEQGSGSSASGGSETAGSLTTTENSEATEFPDTDVGRLMSKVQELKNEMNQKSQLIDDLQQQVKQNEKTLADLTGQAAGGAISYGNTVSESEFKRQYASALDKFYARQYREAIPLFQALIQSNPRNMLVSNCHYWIGESYNGMGNYQQAIQEFSNVLRFTSSYKLDDALIMSGVCYLKLGDSATARQQFQTLVSRYPESEYAPTAMRYLGKL